MWIVRSTIGVVLGLVFFSSCAQAPTGAETDFLSKESATAYEESENFLEEESISSFVVPPDYPMTYYLPEEEWNGLETRAYENLDPAFVAYVHNHPQGTPDPEGVKQGTVSGILCETDRAQYSISRDRTLTIQVSYLNSEQQLEQEKSIYVSRVVNLDRWNGSEWERLLYVPEELYIDIAYAPHILTANEAIEMTVSLDSVVTALRPSKYRAILYVGGISVYAEFELVE